MPLKSGELSVLTDHSLSKKLKAVQHAAVWQVEGTYTVSYTHLTLPTIYSV